MRAKVNFTLHTRRFAPHPALSPRRTRGEGGRKSGEGSMGAVAAREGITTDSETPPFAAWN